MRGRIVWASVALVCSLLVAGAILALLADAERRSEVAYAKAAPPSPTGSAPANLAEAGSQRTQVLSSAPALGVSLEPSNHFPSWGETITYTILMSNTGAALAGGAAMTNTLPNGLSYISGTLQTTGGTAN